jgi:hypothetical protein
MDRASGRLPGGGLAASDAERDAVVERLTAAYSDGRLDAATFAAATEKAWAAVTDAELAGLIAGLEAAA